MHHGLFVASLKIWHERWIFDRELLERLSNSGNISVTENSKDTLDSSFAVIAIDGVLM
jgi:hypothetical protein